jgi:hypothetical protein
MESNYTYQLHVDYLHHNGTRTFDFTNEGNCIAFREHLGERIRKTVEDNPSWQINSHSLALSCDTWVLTIILQQAIS